MEADRTDRRDGDPHCPACRPDLLGLRPFAGLGSPPQRLIADTIGNTRGGLP